MSKVVIDTSVLIRLFNKEKGWEKLLEVFENDIVMSSVNVAEFYTWAVRFNHSLESAKKAINSADIEIINFNDNQAQECAKIFPFSKSFGLSLGDRACLAVSVDENLTVYTCDKVWANLNNSFNIQVI